MSFISLVRQQKMSGYRLSKESGIPQTTVTDLLSRKASLLKCNAETLYRLAQTLGVTMEELLESEMKKKSRSDPFDSFRNEECRQLKKMGDIPYLIALLESGRIQKLYRDTILPQAFYLVGMADYLSRLHDVPLCKDFHAIRKKKLAKAIYPLSSRVASNPAGLKKLEEAALPEFKRFAIMEDDVRKF
jgi:transcriptional regulator with XRE-family HTH domain